MSSTRGVQSFLQSKLFSCGLVFLWMGLIFFASHQEAGNSSKLSTGITEYIVKILALITGKDVFDFSILHFISRKAAHFFAYLILGILIYRALPSPSLKYALLSLSLAMLYAASDEFHQTFVLGRSGEVRDVLLDTSGALLGVLIYYIFRKSRNHNELIRKFQR